MSETWSHKHILLLITARLENEEAYNSGEKSKKQVWKDIHKEILEKDNTFSYSCDSITKKFTNLLTTYKRIKKKQSKTGQSASTWVYFEEFDQVYGKKHFIVAPTENLCDTLNLEDCDDQSDTSETTLEPIPKRKRKPTDVISYIKKMDEEDKKKHEDYLLLEREKLEIEQTKIALEREKIEILHQMKNLLHRRIENMNN